MSNDATSDFDPAAIIADRLTRRIITDGPIPIPAFMMEALFNPTAGFYATKDPIGAGSDFITAPEISQIFGELIGLWSIQSWMDTGSPETVTLIELGPGKATMMRDVLRAARLVPAFLDAAEVCLVEASAALKMVQGQTLKDSPVPIRWAKSLADIKPGPSIILANEFLDCLPVRQAIRQEDQWRERCVGLHDDGSGFIFTLGSVLDGQDIPEAYADCADGTLIELRPSDIQLVDQIADRFDNHPGRALIIDYGPMSPETGDSLQAIRAHEKVDPLDQPGTADLTAHVDFSVLKKSGEVRSLTVAGPVTQHDFLLNLGLEQRASHLAADNPKLKATLARQVHRLTDPDQMGELFKVISLSSDSLVTAPGFHQQTV